MAHEESPTQWHSIRWLGLVCLLDSLRTATINVNSWPFLSQMDSSVTEKFFGSTKTASSLGWILSAVGAGPPMLVGMALALFVCAFYVCVEWFESVAKFIFLAIELALGIATGAISVWRVHVAMASSNADRAKATALTGLAVALGSALGPVILLLVGLGLNKQGLPLPWGTHLSLFTFPGYLCALGSVLAIAIIVCRFDGQMRRKDAIESGKGEAKKRHGKGVDLLAVIVCSMTRFSAMSTQLYLTVLSAPYTKTVFGWDDAQTQRFQSLTSTGLGTLATGVNLAYFLSPPGPTKERPRVLLSIGLALLFFALTFPWPFLTAEIPIERKENVTWTNGTSEERQMANGCPIERMPWCQHTPAINPWLYHAALFLFLGFSGPLALLNLDILYSRVLGPTKQGTLQGVFLASGEGLANLGGPLLIAYVYEKFGPRPIWLAEMALNGLALAAWLFFYRRLVPFGHNNAENGAKKRRRILAFDANTELKNLDHSGRVKVLQRGRQTGGIVHNESA